MDAVAYVLAKKYADEQIAKYKANSSKIVDELPEIGEPGVLYFVPKESEDSGDDHYDTYMWMSDIQAYDKVGAMDFPFDDYFTKDEINEILTTALADKQDVIEDLDTIRSNAELASTAVQPSDLDEYHDDSKQDAINDLDSIRNGAAAGATAIQQSDLESYHDDSKQDSINDLDNIRSGASAGATAIQQSDLESYHDSSKQDSINDLSDIRSGAAAGATAVQPEDVMDNISTATDEDIWALFSEDSNDNVEE